METSGAFGTISQAEHEAKSIRRFIHNWPGLGELDIWLERVKSLSRPALGLVEVSRPSPVNRGRIMQGSEAEWQIDVMGPDSEDFNFWATKRLTDSIQGALWQAQLIPLYYFDWEYPAVKARWTGTVYYQAPWRTTYRVAVVAEDAEGGFSLASVSNILGAAQGDDADWQGFEVVWPEYPSGSGWAVRFWVFYWYPLSTRWDFIDVVEASGREWYRYVYDEETWRRPSESPPFAWRYRGGFNLPTSSTIFARRFMRVSGISSRMLEHPEREGVWNGVITFHTCCDVSRLDKPGLSVVEVPELMGRIESRVSVTSG